MTEQDSRDRRSEPVWVRKVASGNMAEGRLWADLGLPDIIEAQRQWGPKKLDIASECIRLSLKVGGIVEHFHWDWVGKVLYYEDPAHGHDVTTLGIEVENSWQGLSMAEPMSGFSRLGQGGQSIVYIHYLESAPWNLKIPEIGQDPEYTGVGTTLVATCARLSIARGCEGRIGLHSLPRALPFYERLGFVNLGEEPDGPLKGLCYLELPEEAAAMLLVGKRT
jgi:hypothetical protein